MYTIEIHTDNRWIGLNAMAKPVRQPGNEIKYFTKHVADDTCEYLQSRYLDNDYRVQKITV